MDSVGDLFRVAYIEAAFPYREATNILPHQFQRGQQVHGYKAAPVGYNLDE